MLRRKIEKCIENYLTSNQKEVLVITGARQVGKSYIIRQVGQRLFPNYIEINMAEDSMNKKLFENVTSTELFYMRLSSVAGNKMHDRSNTLVVLDEIQTYPQLLTLLKFLREDNRFQYIASGSLLGVTLRQTASIPVGSLEEKRMFPMDFEEFLWAMNFGDLAINGIKEKFEKEEPLDEKMHETVMHLFRKYLLIGGLPESINAYISSTNIVNVRRVQRHIHKLYGNDASKYDEQNRLKIKRVYDMIPSIMENKKKRIVAKDIEGKKGKRMTDYADEFDFLISSGIAMEVQAISKPVFPLKETSTKNLLKLYINDVGILTGLLYGNNIDAILSDKESINLGNVYESAVAQELLANGFPLFYYDNKSRGEIDYLVDDYSRLSVLPIEVKSGKDYTRHSALTNFVNTDEYNISKAYVFSNNRAVTHKGCITYMPIYYVMFLKPDNENGQTF